MTTRLLAAAFFFASAAFSQTPCLIVTGDEILGRDIARALPAFEKIPPEVSLAPSPLAGSTRLFSSSELQSLAARFSIRVDLPHDVCFRIATAPLDHELVLEAMRDGLKLPEARLEIVEISSIPAPVGRIEFTREGLGAPASRENTTPILWRGDVIYSRNRRFAIWAKVRVAVPIQKIFAIEDLRPGLAIKPESIRSEMGQAFPFTSKASLSAGEISGMIPLRSVAAGSEVRPENLSIPNEINRGDLVHVEVRMGAARLALTGLAESAGHHGDTVSIRNPASSRTFLARVEGKGRVLVESSPGGEN